MSAKNYGDKAREKCTVPPMQRRNRALGGGRLDGMFTALVSVAFWAWRLGEVEVGRVYLAGAVRSMRQSWWHWFYTAYDPNGFLSVEKPPLPLWIQAGMVRVFGMHGWSIMLPSLACAAGSAWLVTALARRFTCRAGGVAAGVLFAITPGIVGLSRSNYADIYVIAGSCAALWWAVRSLEGARRAHLVAGAALGLAFMSKGLFSLFSAVGILLIIAGRKTGRRGRILQTIAVWAGVSFWWPSIVDTIGRGRRPYIAHTRWNSAYEQLFIWGSIGGPERPAGNPSEFGGVPGWGRVLESGGDQAYWLIGPAILLGVWVWFHTKMRNERWIVGGLLAWIGTFTAVYSYTGRVVHDYYVANVAAPIVLLAVLGAWRCAEKGALRLLHGAAWLGLGTSVVYVWRLEEVSTWPTVAVASGAAILAAGVIRGGARRRALVLGIALAIGPLTWSVAGVNGNVWEWSPVSRPGNMAIDNTDLIPASFHKVGEAGGTKYSLVLPSYGYSEYAVLAGRAVLPAGGFNGGEQHSLTAARLVAMLEAGEIRYVVRGGWHRYRDDVEEILDERCTLVMGERTGGTVLELHDCRGVEP